MRAVAPLVITTSLLFSGCAINPRVPVDEQRGYIISKSRTNNNEDNKRETWQYWVALEKGQNTEVLAPYLPMGINSCVKVSFYEHGRPTLSSDTGCVSDAPPIKHILVTIDADLADCDDQLKIGMDHSVILHGAGKGAAEGALAGAIAPLQDPVGILLYPIIAPFTIAGGTIIGAGIGAATHIPAEQIPPELLPQVRSIFTELGGAQQIEQSFHQTLIEYSTAIDQQDFELMKNRCIDGSSTTTGYSDAGRDDTLILEASITNIGFMKAKKPKKKSGYAFESDSWDDQLEDDPELILFVYGESRLINTNLKTNSYPEIISYTSPPRKLSEWVSDNYSLLNTELDKVNNTFSEKIMGYYFK